MSYFLSTQGQASGGSVDINTGQGGASAILLVSPMINVTDGAGADAAVQVSCLGQSVTSLLYVDATGYWRMPAVMFSVSSPDGAYPVNVTPTSPNCTVDSNCLQTASVVELDQPDR